jgi:hypothetical protein
MGIAREKRSPKPNDFRIEIQLLNKRIGLSSCSPSEQISALSMCAARLFRATPSTLAFA